MMGLEVMSVLWNSGKCFLFKDSSAPSGSSQWEVFTELQEDVHLQRDRLMASSHDYGKPDVTSD